MAIEDIVRFIYGSGEAWWERVHDESSNSVEPGAPLDDPDLLPGEAPIAQLVWRLIADGGSHMAAHHKWMTAEGGGMWLKPSTTLGRTAAVCASRALYVMTGESRAERRIRALQLLNDEAAGLISYSKDMVKRGDDNANEYLAEAKAYEAQVGEMLEAAGAKPKSIRTDTDLLSEAAESFDAKKVDQAKRQLQMMWRLSSATAHGRAYTWDTGFEDLPMEERLVAAWSISAQLLEATWDRWCQMRVAEGGSNSS